MLNNEMRILEQYKQFIENNFSKITAMALNWNDFRYYTIVYVIS